MTGYEITEAGTGTLTDGTDYDLKAVSTAESNPTYDRVSFSAKHLKCLVPLDADVADSSQ